MIAAVLCIGTELTRGEIVNTNSTWLSEALTGLGAEVVKTAVVADDPERISKTLGALADDADVIICTGGLGPTTDDLTSQTVADLLGVPLERDEKSLDAIRERMTRFGRKMAESNAKQADFPKGARILPNDDGTAPGFSVTLGAGTDAFFLPGVPREMKAMFETQIAPGLALRAPGNIAQIRLKTFGYPESRVNDELAGLEEAHDVIIAYRAHFPEIEVKVLARAVDPEAAAARARAGASAVRERLGGIVYAEGDVTFAEALGEILVERGLMMGTAESCTGGLVAELLTERGGSSAFYAGSIISYTNAIKHSALEVPMEMLEQHGAVSQPVAEAMARGCAKALGVDVACALTGIAGPGGGTEEKPVGLVHYAVATPAGVTAKHRVFLGSRDQIRRRSAFAALDLVRQTLLADLEKA